MSCPKCEPDAKSRSWLWLVGVIIMVAVAAWFEASRSTGAGATTHPTQEGEKK